LIKFYTVQIIISTMPIPDYETIMLPLLKFASDSNEYSAARKAIESLSHHFRLTNEEKCNISNTK
jgi:restriction endonuclease Mrr